MNRELSCVWERLRRAGGGWPLAGLMVLGLGACGPSAPPPGQDVEIRFDARFGAVAVACGQAQTGVGTGGLPIEIGDARFFISNLRLIDAQGVEVPIELKQDSPWQHGNVVLLDFEDATGACSEIGTAETNRSAWGTVPAGEYRGLAFTMGVPFELNHLDNTTAPAPLNVNAMYWSWSSGFVFSRVDYLVAGGDEADAGEGASEPASMAGAGGDAASALEPRPNIAYFAHVGSTGCHSPALTVPPAEPCARPNQVHVRFDAFDPSHDLVVVDLAGMVAGIDVGVSVPRPPGCMSGANDPDCGALFANLGLDIATGDCVDGCREQKLFRVMPQAATTP